MEVDASIPVVRSAADSFGDYPPVGPRSVTDNFGDYSPVGPRSVADNFGDYPPMELVESASEDSMPEYSPQNEEHWVIFFPKKFCLFIFYTSDIE